MKNKNIIKELNEMLENEKKLTIESIVFNENEENTEMDNYVNDEYSEEDNSEAEYPQDQEINNGIQDKINQIRQICLQTISELADNPTSNEYDLMKKIWNLCDKTLEGKKENVNT